MPWILAGGAALSAGSGLLSGIIGSGASKSAASQSAAAAQAATNLNTNEYNQTRGDLQPWMTQGRHAMETLGDKMGALSNPTDLAPLPQQMTQANLEATPGYQFNLSQGLKSVQNSAAARGLGSSGAALKGAATYATGLADSTYQNQFNNQLQMFNAGQTADNNVYNRLIGIAGLGENAAAAAGNNGAQTAGNAGNALIAGGQAQAAGTTGSASALAGGINGVGNSAMNYLMMSKMFGGGGSGGGQTQGLQGGNFGFAG